MYRMMLKSKIHRAVVTGTALHYEGSIAIDAALLEEADLLPNEQVQVYNIDNGARFTTYILRARRGSGVISLNGAAARLGARGDRVIIAAYASVSEEEAPRFRPRVVSVDERNRIRRRSSAHPS
jgi:aspartate 1-decarboxylase